MNNPWANARSWVKKFNDLRIKKVPQRSAAFEGQLSTCICLVYSDQTPTYPALLFTLLEWVHPFPLKLSQDSGWTGYLLSACFPNYSFLLSKHTLGDSSRTTVCQSWLEQSVLFQHQYIFQAESGGHKLNGWVHSIKQWLVWLGSWPKYTITRSDAGGLFWRNLRGGEGARGCIWVLLTFWDLAIRGINK